MTIDELKKANEIQEQMRVTDTVIRELNTLKPYVPGGEKKKLRLANVLNCRKGGYAAKALIFAGKDTYSAVDIEIDDDFTDLLKRYFDERYKNLEAELEKIGK